MILNNINVIVIAVMTEVINLLIDKVKSSNGDMKT